MHSVQLQLGVAVADLDTWGVAIVCLRAHVCEVMYTSN